MNAGPGRSILLPYFLAEKLTQLLLKVKFGGQIVMLLGTLRVGLNCINAQPFLYPPSELVNDYIDPLLCLLTEVPAMKQ